MTSTMPNALSSTVEIEVLRDIGLFGGLDDATLTRLTEALRPERLEPGALLMIEGETKPELFVVLSGELEVIKRAHDHDVRIAMIGPGDWVGEMTILDVQPRSATVRAIAPTTFLRLSASGVDQIFYRRDVKAYAILITNIARELSRRLRVADAILAQTMTAMSQAYLQKR